MQILVLPAFQPVFLQPCADGDVVEFQGRTGYEDGQDKDAGGYHDMGVQRGVRVGVFPVEQHVYQREVGDVERVGEFSEKVAYLLAPCPCYAASGSDVYYDREYQQDAQGIVDSVEDVAFPAYAWDGEDNQEDEGAPPESAFHTDEPAESGDEKSAEERIEQSCQAYVYLFRREAPPSDRGVHLCIAGFREQPEHVEVQAEVKGEKSGGSDKDAKGKFGQMPEDEGVQYVGEIFPCQGPVRAVEGVGFTPSPDVHLHSARYHQAAHNEGEGHFPSRHIPYQRKCFPLSEEVEAGSGDGSHDDHRVKPCKPSFEESADSHPVPSVIVGISYHEPRKCEEEVHGKVAVIALITAIPD